MITGTIRCALRDTRLVPFSESEHIINAIYWPLKVRLNNATPGDESLDPPLYVHYYLYGF